MGFCQTVWADLRSLQNDEDRNKPAICVKCRSCGSMVWFSRNFIDPSLSSYRCSSTYLCGLEWPLRQVLSEPHYWIHWFYTTYPDPISGELWAIDFVDDVGKTAFHRLRPANDSEVRERGFQDLQLVRKGVED